MKFVIILLAFFIPLLTSTRALKCLTCQGTIRRPPPSGKSLPFTELGRAREMGPDCSTNNATVETCKSENAANDFYCATVFLGNNQLLARLCLSISEAKKHDVIISDTPGCQIVDTGRETVVVCLCNNKDNCNDQNTSNILPLKCYECQPLPGIPGFGDWLSGLQWSEAQNGTKKVDCSKSKGIKKTCPIAAHMYCATITPEKNKVSARNCMKFPPYLNVKPPGCAHGPPHEYRSRLPKAKVCLCKSDFCNGHTKIVGMSPTILLGSVLALSLLK